jgi:hypothetical protein
VRSVSDPQSSHYRDYLTVEQIVHRFGAKPAAKKATMQWLTEHGAHGHLDATGTYVVARIPAGIAAKALPARRARIDRHADSLARSDLGSNANPSMRRSSPKRRCGCAPASRSRARRPRSGAN